MAKALKPKTKKEELMKEIEPIEPEVVGDVEVEEKVKDPVKDVHEQTFSVKLGTKKIEGRKIYQVLAIVQGALGGVDKITIEQE